MDVVQGVVILATLVLLMIGMLVITGPAELLSGVQEASARLLTY